MRSHGQLRHSQIITTYGPGSLIDLPRYSAMVAGLDQWPRPGDLQEIIEPRLSSKLGLLTGTGNPRLYAPPPESNDPSSPNLGIVAYRFPEWFLVQELDGADRKRSRRLVHRKALDEKGRFEGRPVVATRFLRACRKGHVADLDWHGFVHQDPDSDCPRTRQLFLDERGTSGDLGDLYVRCECGKVRSLYEATQTEMNPLGMCQGNRPWLGNNTREDCRERSRLLIRTASNAYFPQIVSVLSLPDRGSAVETVVRELWEDLQIVDSAAELATLKKKPRIADRLREFDDETVLTAIQNLKRGSIETRPVKHVELDAILAVPEGFGDDVPVNANFHARRLPDSAWRNPSGFSEGIAAVVQLHRLREVLALVGFTRFEAISPDINGEFETDVVRADLDKEPSWFPAIENRGEGIFIQLSADAVARWQDRPAVQGRLEALKLGHDQWCRDRKSTRLFPGGPYILLHTLSHLLIQSLSMRCGYPASSIRERIYAHAEIGQFGILLYTGSQDAEGTLGGLVQQARYIEDHLQDAILRGSLCSNDPICAHHNPSRSLERRWLHGASCHGCSLLAETSCEMRNDYLDRALVVPVLGVQDAAFFRAAL